jgi:IPT/TIG domain
VSRATRLSVVFGAGALLASVLAFPSQAASAAGAASVAPVAASVAVTRPANYGSARQAGPHLMPVSPPGLHHPSAPAGAHLNYYDGPVLSNMKSVDVSYGGGTFISTGHPGASWIASFTGQWLGSGVMDWLSEYDTNVAGGTNQLIGRGTYNGTVTITPAAADNGTNITDTEIQAELNAQISAGHLPAPDANTSYALFFRLGQSICMGTSCSLVSGGFCAYHSTFTAPNGVIATYQVMPDLTGTFGCGNSTDLNNTTSVLSHELAETITDPQVGFASVFAPPLAWYDPANGEIGDICNAQQGTFVGGDGNTYTVQQLFSNVANNCIVTRSLSSDFSISASPTSLSVARGGSGASTISTAVAAGAPATISLSVSGAPAGVTAGLAPTSVTAGFSSTLTVNVGTAAAPGTYTLTVKGIEGTATHSVPVALTVPAAGAMVSPASGPPGTSVTVSGTGFGASETVKVIYKTGLVSPASVVLCATPAAADGTFSCSGSIPAKPTAGAKGAHTIVVKGQTSLTKAKITFTRT